MLVSCRSKSERTFWNSPGNFISGSNRYGGIEGSRLLQTRYYTSGIFMDARTHAPSSLNDARVCTLFLDLQIGCQAVTSLGYALSYLLP